MLPPDFVIPPGNIQLPNLERLQYEGMLLSLDRVVGDILDVVDLSETLVVFLGDNGTPRTRRVRTRIRKR